MEEESNNSQRIYLIAGFLLIVFLCGCLVCAIGASAAYLFYKASPAPLGGGGFIAYTSNVGNGTTEIRVYNVKTQEDTLVLSGKAYKFWYSWSPDNQSILFQSDFHPPISRVFMIDPDGSNLRTILDDPESRSWLPHISPDGKKVAFCSDRTGEFNIYVMNLDGTDLTRLTDFDSCNPQWSPDGSQIAFHSDVTGDFDIYKMDADGSNLVNLTNNPATDMGPNWSPDGKRISFISSRNSVGENTDIFIMNSDGSGVVDLTNNPSTNSGGSWSPDGRYLVFESNRTGGYQLYFIEVDNPIAALIPVASENPSAPTWSH